MNLAKKMNVRCVEKADCDSRRNLLFEPYSFHQNKRTQSKDWALYCETKTTSYAGVNRKAFSFAHRQKFSPMLELVFADTKLDKGENFCYERK